MQSIPRLNRSRGLADSSKALVTKLLPARCFMFLKSPMEAATHNGERSSRAGSCLCNAKLPTFQIPCTLCLPLTPERCLFLLSILNIDMSCFAVASKAPASSALHVLHCFNVVCASTCLPRAVKCYNRSTTTAQQLAAQEVPCFV